MQVLEVIKSEKMMSSANMIGKQLRRSLLNLRDRCAAAAEQPPYHDIPTTRFPCVGDVRGCGLVQSLEIVEDKEGKVGTNNHNNDDMKLASVSRWPVRSSPRRSCSG